MPSTRGYFEGDDRQPYVDADVLLPRLGVTAKVSFFVDTGADATTLHWGDRLLLRTREGEQLPADVAFPDQVQAYGIAGVPVRYGREDAVLVFRTEEGTLVASDIRLSIEATPSLGGVPSLLGRDLLSELRLDFNMPADDLVLEWAS